MSQSYQNVSQEGLLKLNSLRDELNFTGFIQECVNLDLDLNEIGNYHSKYSLLGWAITLASIEDVELLLQHHVDISVPCFKELNALKLIIYTIATLGEKAFPANFDPHAYENKLNQIEDLLNTYQEKYILEQQTQEKETHRKTMNQKI